MQYNIAGPTVDSDVDQDRIRRYYTTRSSCGCPANYFGKGVCKHLEAVKHGCPCPVTLWFAHQEYGRQLVCAETRCEYGAIYRQALYNEGWVDLRDGAMPRMLCHVCNAEVLPNQKDERGVSLRYCYNGEHWISVG